MVKKFEVYINVEDVYSFRVETEDKEAADDLIQDLFNDHGMDFHCFLNDYRTDKGQCWPLSDYQIEIIEIIPQEKADEILQRNITDRMRSEDLDD